MSSTADERPPITVEIRVAAGCIYAVICVIGLIANISVLTVFFKVSNLEPTPYGINVKAWPESRDATRDAY